jgi:hypothetical protein
MVMKAWLIVREGPGAGLDYRLDPFEKRAFSVGRSSDCDIVMLDQRASRHHCDIRWNGHGWEVLDCGSTNGTYVNGMQIHRPCELRIGDRVTLGETTMVLAGFSRQPAAPPQSLSPGDPVRAGEGAVGPRQPAQPPQPAPHRAGRAAPRQVEGLRPASTATAVAFWLIQLLITAAVVCLAAGAFLPWLQVSGSLSQDLEPLLQGIANIVSILSGPDSMLNMTQEIGGLEGYGKLTLAVAVMSLVAFVLDIFFHRRSPAPGIVYLVSGLVATGAIAFDLINYYRFYDQMKDLSLLFGIRLEQVVQVFDRFLDVQITPMIGLVLTGAGLALLLLGGIGRLGLALFVRNRQA